MQLSITQRSATILALDPTRRMSRYFWIWVGIWLAWAIGSFFLPEPIRSELVWGKSSPLSKLLFNYINSEPSVFPQLLLTVLYCYTIPAIFIWPFAPIFILGRLKRLEPARQRTAKNHFSGISMATFPLPEVFTHLPATLSIQMRRNWRATWIAGMFYTLLMGLLFWDFASGWQSNILYLAQRGMISSWTLLGSIFYGLPYCVCILPAITAFILAPRQQLIATQDGLVCRHGLRFNYIPWHEARLFAVIAEQQITLVCELASSTSIIRWSSTPQSNYADNFPAATVGIAPLCLVRPTTSTEEYQWQIRLLTALVAARTNLPLYDLRRPMG